MSFIKNSKYETTGRSDQYGLLPLTKLNHRTDSLYSLRYETRNEDINIDSNNKKVKFQHPEKNNDI